MKKDKLEEFIQNNKEEINQFEPTEGLWDNIESVLDGENDNVVDFTKRKEAKHIKLYTRHIWQVAAVFLVLAVSGYFIFKNQFSAKDTQEKNVEQARKGVSLEDLNPELAEAESHYVQMISQKREEIKEQAKNLDLDKSFYKDLSKLDSMYTVLKDELYEVPSQEDIQAAMIQNLQMRIEILNQQLQILKRLKQFQQKDKNKEDENIKSL